MSGYARPVGLSFGAVLLVLAVASCGSPSQASPGSSSSPAIAHFDGDDLSFDYPGTWRRASFPVVSSFSNVLVYLSTAPMADPCDRTPSSIACVRSAVASLGPDGVLVEWSRLAWPGWTFDRSKGKPAIVGGRAATIEQLEPDEPCRAIGGSRELVVTIDDPVPDQNWTEARACLAGPLLDGPQADVEAMLGTVVFHR